MSLYIDDWKQHITRSKQTNKLGQLSESIKDTKNWMDRHKKRENKKKCNRFIHGWSMNYKTTNALWTETESCVSTESYHFESYNCLSNPSQKQAGETQRSTKRKWRRHALFSSIIVSVALLLPQQKHIALKQNTEPPAAPEELLHGQPYKIALELGSSQTYVFDIWPLFLCGCPSSNSCRREWGSAMVGFCYTRHASDRCTPHLFIPEYVRHVVIIGFWNQHITIVIIYWNVHLIAVLDIKKMEPVIKWM